LATIFKQAAKRPRPQPPIDEALNKTKASFNNKKTSPCLEQGAILLSFRFISRAQELG